jgi:hypothetical protein
LLLFDDVYYYSLWKYFRYFSVNGIPVDPAVYMAVVVSDLIGLIVFDGQYFMEIEVPVHLAHHDIPLIQRRILLYRLRDDRLPDFRIGVMDSSFEYSL